MLAGIRLQLGIEAGIREAGCGFVSSAAVHKAQPCPLISRDRLLESLSDCTWVQNDGTVGSKN